jgi:hypothetical protein
LEMEGAICNGVSEIGRGWVGALLHLYTSKASKRVAWHLGTLTGGMHWNAGMKHDHVRLNKHGMWRADQVTISLVLAICSTFKST